MVLWHQQRNGSSVPPLHNVQERSELCSIFHSFVMRLSETKSLFIRRILSLHKVSNTNSAGLESIVDL